MNRRMINSKLMERIAIPVFSFNWVKILNIFVRTYSFLDKSKNIVNQFSQKYSLHNFIQNNMFKSTRIVYLGFCETLTKMDVRDV